MQPWNQIKLMLVGQEEVGKTTLLRALQDEKYDRTTNISTNGVNIAKVNLRAPPSSLISKILNQRDEAVQFNVWDFGGQAVFHSTHRFFMTPNAVYLVVYDLNKPATYERLK